MKTSPKIIYFLLILFSSSLYGQSLDDYLRIAAENNPGLRAHYLAFEAEIQRIDQVSALPDPKLSFGYFISPVETRVGPQRTKLGLSQAFPWFGTLAARSDMASKNAEQKYQLFLNAKNELFLQVKAAWYPLYELKAHQQLIAENKKILLAYQQLSLAAVRNGKGSLADAIRVEILLEEADFDIQLLEDKLKPLTVRFNRLLNQEEDVPIVLPDSIFLEDISLHSAKDSIAAENPLMKSLDLKLQAAEAAELIAVKQGLPSFTVGLDYVMVNKRQDVVMPSNGRDILMPMVGMSLPVFRKKYRASVKEAQIIQEKITLSRQELENELSTKYESAWFELEKNQQLLALYRIQTSKTETAIELLLKSYANDGDSFEEVLRLQQQLLKYKMAESSAFTAFFIALARIDNLTAKTDGL